MKLFGFTLGKEKKKSLPSFVPKDGNILDDSTMVSSTNFSGSFYNFDDKFKSDNELINKYRQMSMNAEVELAIDDIVSESVITEDSEIIKIAISDEISKPVAEKISNEFSEIIL